jgi:hypothetical protein
MANIHPIGKGGKREGAGRPKGAGNLTPKPVREMALQHAETVLMALVEIVQDRDAPPSARVAACKEILDRADGKPAQRIEQTITDKTGGRFNDIVDQIRAELTP